MTRVTELEYRADSAERFAALLGRPWAVFLDSGPAAGHPDARYDVFACDPYVTLTTHGGVTEIASRLGVERSARDPLDLLRERLGPPVPPVPGLPFAGGAVGYVAYDYARRLERLPARTVNDVAMPDVAFGLYDWAAVVDHRERRAWLVGQGRDERTFARWDALVERLERAAAPRGGSFEVLEPPRSDFDRESYGAAFRRVQAHIRAGDCYQINLTQRFAARVAGDAWLAYGRLRRLNPAPFAAFLDLPDGAVLCSSPERFLRVRDGRVETRPIKGTRARDPDPRRDRLLTEQLRASAKDRAENVMIVDLLRNDLGKSCAPGSVRATRLFDVESFATVHHLVSTIEGRLAAGKDALDLLRGCFPGGSITGAPKVRAMQIIEEVERHRRSVYCGAIGYVAADGGMDMNIAIRTMVQHAGHVYAWAGGGIVADSEADAEYQESLDKLAALLAVLRP
ncbi:MAG TPA: aminodeoxychorismate synthase component I [Gammaproteobacteria bacterium]